MTPRIMQPEGRTEDPGPAPWGDAVRDPRSLPSRFQLFVRVLATGFLLLATIRLGLAEELEGAALYQKCAVCHQSAAQGVPMVFPALVDRLGSLGAREAGRDYLVMVIVSGLMGPIDVGGVTYTGIMPPQGPAFGNHEISTVLNYVLTSFNSKTLPKDWRAFTAAEVAAIKARYPAAHLQTTQSMRKAAFHDSE